uniref:Transglutaminase 5, like n=1 Tax=Poecilia latipinna TaxID=48699 RepID=A0A3B3UH76_9TELE
MELAENQQRHRTNGFRNSKELVVRRGAPFNISVKLKGRPFNPQTDSLRIKTVSAWHKSAFATSCTMNLQELSVTVSSPASAPVGCYKFQLYVFTQDGQKSFVVGDFILLCNPWCSEDAVYIPFEDQREEYVLSDSGLLFMGTPNNLVSRPWSFDLYEPGILEACLDLLKVSPQHQKNRKKDYMNRSNPVYISRVVSAMINSEDDCGVLKGNWTGDFKQGVSPSKWTGSGDILRLWVKSGYSPVKYGQCWVFAAVMCTVMRVLGIPSRVITNFNSAHDTNANLVIEEYYSETGQKLNRSNDSIWNFHVWVECWMRRSDLEPKMDGWQVLDPTPQERSGGVFCCGPAPVKGIRNQRTDLIYDIPFVYAAVNADVHTIILSSHDQVVGFSKDTERIGSLICTKAIGYPRVQNITGDYKWIKSRNPKQNIQVHFHRTTASKGVIVFLTLAKHPVAGEPIVCLVKIMNKQKIPKMMKVHLNAQAKEYNHSPSETFWEKHGVIQLEHILPTQYEHVVGDDLINLAVVLEDMATSERVLASEEFNIATSGLTIQVLIMFPSNTLAFQNPEVAGYIFGEFSGFTYGLFSCRSQRKIPLCQTKTTQSITLKPSMAGVKMLQASLSLSDTNITIRSFKMISVNSI